MIGLVALVEAAALVAVVVAFAGVVARMQRAHARREQLLIDQLLHAVGKPWTPAPVAERHHPLTEADELLERAFTPTPEQEPVD